MLKGQESPTRKEDTTMKKTITATASTVAKIATFRALYGNREFIHTDMPRAYAGCPCWKTLKDHGVLVATGRTFEYEVDGVLVAEFNIYKVQM